MNEQLQQALAAILGKAVQGVEAGVSFLSGQIPDVIQQLLVWKLVMALVGAGVALLLILFLSWYLYNAARPIMLAEEQDGPGRYQRAVYKKTFWHDSNGDMNEPAFFGTIAATVIGTVLLIPFGMNLCTALQIWLAPKIYLIEYAASLAKGG